MLTYPAMFSILSSTLTRCSLEELSGIDWETSNDPMDVIFSRSPSNDGNLGDYILAPSVGDLDTMSAHEYLSQETPNQNYLTAAPIIDDTHPTFNFDTTYGSTSNDLHLKATEPGLKRNTDEYMSGKSEFIQEPDQGWLEIDQMIRISQIDCHPHHISPSQNVEMNGCLICNSKRIICNSYHDNIYDPIAHGCYRSLKFPNRMPLSHSIVKEVEGKHNSSWQCINSGEERDQFGDSHGEHLWNIRFFQTPHEYDLNTHNIQGSFHYTTRMDQETMKDTIPLHGNDGSTYTSNSSLRGHRTQTQNPMQDDQDFYPALQQECLSALHEFNPHSATSHEKNVIPHTPVTQHVTSINSNDPFYATGFLSSLKFNGVTHTPEQACKPTIALKEFLENSVCSAKNSRLYESNTFSMSLDRGLLSIQPSNPNILETTLFGREPTSDIQNNTLEKLQQETTSAHVEGVPTFSETKFVSEPMLTGPQWLERELEHSQEKSIPSEPPGFVAFKKPAIPVTQIYKDRRLKASGLKTMPLNSDESSVSLTRNTPRTVALRRAGTPGYEFWNEINKANGRLLMGAYTKKIETYVLVKLNQLAGIQLMKDEDQTLRKYRLDEFFFCLERKLLSSRVVKNTKDSHGQFFVKRLLGRVRGAITPCFLYLAKETVELFSELGAIPVFESRRHGLENAVGFIKGYWKNRFEEYEVELKDLGHQKLMEDDEPTGRYLTILPDQALNDNEMRYMDSLAFIRRKYTWSPFIWTIFSRWLRNNAPDWYQLDHPREHISKEPSISKALKTCINNYALRRKIVRFMKGEECEFQYSQMVSLKWDLKDIII